MIKPPHEVLRGQTSTETHNRADTAGVWETLPTFATYTMSSITATDPAERVQLRGSLKAAQEDKHAEAAAGPGALGRCQGRQVETPNLPPKPTLFLFPQEDYTPTGHR